MNKVVSLLVFASLFTATASTQTLTPAQCAAPDTREKVSACVAAELRREDARINNLYQLVMAKRDAAGRDALRASQREWIATRDRDCQLSISDKGRERWFEIVAVDAKVAVCVTNQTRYRIAVLEALDAGKPAPSADFVTRTESNAAKMAGVQPDASGKPRLPTRHADGKWYFEVDIDRAAASKAGVRSIMAGFLGTDNGEYTCNLHEIHAGDFGKLQLGLAIDLDNGMVYFRVNGSWNGKEPGSNRGMAVKLGQEYMAQVRASERPDELFSSGAVVSNFGDSPFFSPVPAGYRKWR